MSGALFGELVTHIDTQDLQRIGHVSLEEALFLQQQCALLGNIPTWLYHLTMKYADKDYEIPLEAKEIFCEFGILSESGALTPVAQYILETALQEPV